MSLKIRKSLTADADVVLHAGDCLRFLKKIPDSTVSLVVTSPPYNIGKAYEKRTSLDEYVAWQSEVITQCHRVLRSDGHICWQVGNYVKNSEIVPLDILLYPVFHELGMQMRNRIVWHFGHGLHASKRFSGRYEVIMWFSKSDSYVFDLDPVRVPQKYPGKKHFKGKNKGKLSGNPLGKNPSDVWEIPNVKANHVEKTDHPCQFPIELVERLVVSMTRKGSWVLDPFAGVGTVAVAAAMHGRRSIGCELDPMYVDIARERLRDAQSGNLLMRPRERSVYDPTRPSSANVPPQTVRLSGSARRRKVSVR